MARRRTSSRRRRVQYRRAPPKKKSTKKRKRSSAPAAKKILAANVADFIMPHINVPPVRHPDGNSAKTFQIVLESTGILQPNEHVTGDGKVNGQNVSVWFPGDITASHYLAPTVHASNPPNIMELGPGRNTTDRQQIVDSCESFRVTGATLKIEYIGGNMDNGGEIVLKKFDPADYSIEEGGNSRDLGDIPRTVDEHCKATKFLRAKDGAFVVFGRSDQSEFSDFNNPVNTTSAASLEGLVVFLQGCDEDVQSWRFVLTQSIEVRPKTNTFLARLAQQPPASMPIFQTTATIVQGQMHNRNMDMVPASHANAAYSHCVQCCMSSIDAAAGQTGYNIPKSTGSLVS